ncbi:MAG: gamma-glutamyltransferase [Gemmatimonadetes bacterium]|nr:gamma-glutamyltransferase [Gemmatimonadota bacterium]
MRPAVVGLLSTALLAAARASVAQQMRPSTMAGRSTVYAPHGVVATSQPLASAAGLAVLERGGNAIDAAVTAAAVLSVVEPHMTGIGGDMFALVWLAKEKRLVALNASGRAGSRASREAILARGHDRIPRGAEAVTVPGALSGWAALLERYGTRTLAQALEPAIRYADEGFPVSPIIAREWQAETARLRRDPGARATFLIDGTHAPAAGEWFRNPDYAATLRLIARNGPGVLYGGELGRRIVEHLDSLGGFLTLDDLRAHRAEWVTPISVPFKGYRVWELPPNGQGIAALEMLRILEAYDLKAMGHNSAPYLHHLIEAKKLAYADLERWIGDPAAMSVPAERLLSDDFVAARRRALDETHAADRPEPGAADVASETVYLTAADADGNMVSFINSNYDEFGSGIVVPGTGFVLHDRGLGLTMEPGRANTIAPGRRPLHTIIPAFVTRTGPAGEEPVISFGVMGGSMQPQGHVQFLLNYLVFGMDPQQAVDAARFRHLSGRRVALESAIGDDVHAALRAMGHDVVEGDGVAFGGAQVIIRLPRGYAAASDPRKDGHAAAY